MIKITPEMASLLHDILWNFVIPLISAILGIYLTYVFAIKRILQERLLKERVSLYRPLVHSLFDLIDLSDTDPDYLEKLKDLETKLNRLGRDLLLYAPDDVYRHFTKAMSTVKVGAKPTEVIDFIIALREELIGKTDISPEEFFTLLFRPKKPG